MIDPQRCQQLLTPGDLTDADVHAILDPIGFDDPDLALERLRSLTPDDELRWPLARTLPALLFALTEAATPDSSLLNFQRLVQTTPHRLELLSYLAEHPRAIEILVRLFVGSQFLTEILLRNPNYLQRVTQHKRIAEFKHRQELFEAGRQAVERAANPAEQLNALRRFQQWELLRLAACDSFRLMDLKTVTLQLALLADSLAQNCLNVVAAEVEVDPDDFAVLAFGKLGGEELNYSSDIDLVFVCEKNSERYWGLGQKLIRALGDSTEEGFLYRVDMRLRPWGSSGALVSTCDSYVDYLKRHGQLWEKQALLKARAIAGNHDVGNALLERLKPVIFDVTPDEARENVLDMKRRIEDRLQREGGQWGQVKAGAGSIRDVEFVTQYLQLANGRDMPAVRSANTLDGLVRLADFGMLHGDEFRFLSSGYVFLRSIEHALQLMHNKQVHALPDNPRELDYLARRLDFPGRHEFVRHYEQHCAAIRKIFDKYIVRGANASTPSEPTPRRTVAMHLGEAAASYHELFSDEQAERHLTLLDQLDKQHPVITDARSVADGRWELTIVGYDQIGDLSLMCGLLFVYGFDIESGYVFTGAEVAEHQPVTKPASRRRGTAKRPNRSTRKPRLRKFVNVFTVRPPDGTLSAAVWNRYESELRELIELAERSPHREAHAQLARRVADAIPPAAARRPRILLPVQVSIDNDVAPDATVMHIRAEDTTGFLYELTNALALYGVSIQRVLIRSQAREVVDTLWLVDAKEHKITDSLQLNELRAAVVLIKHFTHLLPRAPNPPAALLNFREFLEALFAREDWVRDLASLQDSQVLENLARLLGVSDFLWHDFLRLQHDNLFPVVTNIAGLQKPKPKSQLETELAAALDAAAAQEQSTTARLEARRDALNAFKDREMLRVDMRHILGLQHQFGMFSGELTDIAEVVVDGAFRICLEHLRAEFGEPRSDDGRPCRLAICALGKCGGRELGFASDIELMFVYDVDGHTTGPGQITNSEFFQKLVDLFTRSIRAKRKGIFEVDLRLRPYGKAGSPAVSLETFEKYFSFDGPAWPYERQALVKLRPIAGDAEFGTEVVAARDAICYSGRPFDVTAMRAMREKQLTQLVRAGTFNAKLSPGGLVDCEYLVQGLQMTYGHKSRELRDPNTRTALKALRDLGVLTEEQRVEIRDAYRFLRRIIDGLRMVRGDARDLTVPPPDTEEFEFLARRLDYQPADLHQELEQQTTRVQSLTRLLDELPAGV